MRALALQLAARSPDIVALQESFSSIDGSHDTAAHLGHALGLNVCFVPARCKRRLCDGKWIDSCSGLALLTNCAFGRCVDVPLPSTFEDGGRAAQICQINAGTRSVLIANVHLSHLAEVAELRRRQLETVLSHELFKHRMDAAIVCGDFNAEIQSPELQYFFGPPWRLIDTHHAGGGEAKVTCLGEDARWRDLDHIFSVQDGHGSRPGFRNSVVVLDTVDASSGVMPSDHRGVETCMVFGDDSNPRQFVI